MNDHFNDVTISGNLTFGAQGTLTVPSTFGTMVVGNINDALYVDGLKYPTIASAITAVSSGGTVVVPPGTYTENLTISKPLHLVGASTRATTITSTSGTTITLSGASAPRFITIENMTVDSTGATGDSISIGDNVGNVTLRNLLGNPGRSMVRAVAGASGFPMIQLEHVRTGGGSAPFYFDGGTAGLVATFRETYANGHTDVGYSILGKVQILFEHPQVDQSTGAGLGYGYRFTGTAQQNVVMLEPVAESNGDGATFGRGFSIEGTGTYVMILPTTGSQYQSIYIDSANADVHMYSPNLTSGAGNSLTVTATSTGHNFLHNRISGTISVAAGGVLNRYDLLRMGAVGTSYPIVLNDTTTTARGFIGASVAAGDIITGSGANDINIRTQGTSIIESTDSGATIKRQLDTSGNTRVFRIKASLGTALAAGDFALNANFGTGATVSAIAATDQGGRVTITTGTTAGANPTATLTFKDGTWTSAPSVTVSKGDVVAPAAGNGEWRVTSVSATQAVFTFDGTPSDSTAYIFDFNVMGR